MGVLPGCRHPPVRWEGRAGGHREAFLLWEVGHEVHSARIVEAQQSRFGKSLREDN